MTAATFLMLVFGTWLLLVPWPMANGLFDFPKTPIALSEQDQKYLNSISAGEWQQCVRLGTDSVAQEEKLEENLMLSQITVETGSVSHVQLLDSLPNSKAREDSEVAMKMLKSSMYVYHTKCAQNGVLGVDCAAFLENQPLPAGSDLLRECTKIIQNQRDGHHPFRRLLPRLYADDFHQMFSEAVYPAPLAISNKVMQKKDSVSREHINKSLAFVQWAQFIEHDLSKPVVTSMNDGSPIQCCDNGSYKLQPRYTHPACAPMYGSNPISMFSRKTCLSYVRSALAVGSKCTFGALEQLNQATGSLDLSQLYGFTDLAQRSMRSYRNGKLKSTSGAQLKEDLLPMATMNSHEFCDWKPSSKRSICFMAGDSRVNTNPFAILIYTIFLRNHNQIAGELKSRHPNWNDERLYQTAMAINIDTYRRIVFEEWLPEAVGGLVSDSINNINVVSNTDDALSDRSQISNEFAVAAIRFYFSMMPNELRDFAASSNTGGNTKPHIFISNNVLPVATIFQLEDQIYKPDLAYSSAKLDDILESLLHQGAMEMDTSYVDCLTAKNSGSTIARHADILALDIQRGRDHGLQKYVKYLEECANVRINSWRDFEAYITKEDIDKLKNAYGSWSEIDLIVGGIAEIPMNGSTVGPTFTCIIAEQFSKIRQYQQTISPIKELNASELKRDKAMRAADLFCANSELKYAPENIFQLGSETNPLKSCADRLAALLP